MSKITHWIKADLTIIELSKMHRLHLVRTIKMIKGTGKQEFPDVWQGITKDEWLIVLKNELKSRNKS